MEILSSQSIWKQYYKSLPYHISVAYTRTRGDIVERGIYFDGLTAGNAVSRVFAAIYTRELNKTDILKSRATDFDDEDRDNVVRALGHYDRCVLFFDDVEPSSITPSTFLDSGYCVIKVDFLGTSNTPHCTRYPNTLSNCNYCNDDSNIKDIFSCNHYVWAYNALRSVNLALMAFNDVSVYGKGLGGSIAYKTLYSNNIKNAVIVGNILPDVIGDDDTLLFYRAALDNSAYAKQTVAPTLMIMATNDSDNSIDRMSDLARDTASLKDLIILPRATLQDELASTAQPLLKFLDTCQFYQTPAVNVYGEDHSMYLNITAEASATNINVYVSTAITKPKFRNWTNVKITKSGQSEWLAKCSVFSLDYPIVYFVCVDYEDGHTSSTPVTSVNVKQLGITPKQKIRRRLLYSADDGLDNWYSPIHRPQIKEAALKIEGLTSPSNELITYKPGDFLYHAEHDNIMQLTIYGAPQTLNLEMTDSEGIEYSANITLKGEDWQKLTLSHENLKSSVKPLESFNSIVKLKLKGTDCFYLNSILWV